MRHPTNLKAGQEVRLQDGTEWRLVCDQDTSATDANLWICRMDDPDVDAFVHPDEIKEVL